MEWSVTTKLMESFPQVHNSENFGQTSVNIYEALKKVHKNNFHFKVDFVN